MRKIHVTVVALVLGLSGALGIAAATQTAGLRATAAAPNTSEAAIAARTQRLNKVERSINLARRDRPPALPAIPTARASKASQAQHVVYQRPAPVVVVKHNPHHESEAQHENEGGDD
jgi:hypothetical protein